ncbi:MAG: hypothetical protein AAGF49_01585 [Pseudomonadota bacterium]
MAAAVLALSRAAGPQLTPGDPLVYWEVGETFQERFDVPDEPMSGDMDPFFFVTDTKNFIPHEYPCRTIFAGRNRHQRPEPVGLFRPMRNHLPFEAERLDLSGFWFRPTHIATHARTLVESVGGSARFRLTTPGGAVLSVNGTEAGWLAPYRRNLAEAVVLDVGLVPGENRIEVFFDDLAERDTAHFFRLDLVEGHAVPLLPFGAAAQTVRAVEATLSAMHFDQPFYEGGPVVILLPQPLPNSASVEVVIEGDFMSHERATMTFHLPAGAGAIEVADAQRLPADFRHFRVTVTMDGFTASRTLGVEIAHPIGRASPTVEARIEEALDHVARMAEPDTVCALARLATGRKGEDTAAMIERALRPIAECWDCADFALVPLLWGRIRYADALPEALLAKIDETVLAYRYWMDEPGNDVQWYFSENHALLFHTAAYLAGHLLPDRVFARSGRTGAEQSAVGRERVRAWLDHFEKWEMAEFNSAPYFPIDLKGLTALQALAPDEAIRTRAAAAIHRLVELVANSAHRGVVTGAQGRSYEHTLRASRTLELSAIARLLWGEGSFGARFHALPQLALCLRDHGLKLSDLSSRAVVSHEDEEWEWSCKQGENGFAALHHVKTLDWALGTAAGYRWFEWGYQETLLQDRIGEEAQAQAVINHPGERIHSGYGRPSFWGGSASIPRVQQHRGLAIAVFDGRPEQPGFTHALFPVGAFDSVFVDGCVAVGAAGRGRLVLVASGPLRLVGSGPSAGSELRLDGLDGRWIMRVLQSDKPPETLAHTFGRLTIDGPTRGRLTVSDPQYGDVIFHPNATVDAEGIRQDPSEWTVEGTRRVKRTPTLR